MMVPTSASVILRTKEIASRRKCMSRAAKLVLNSSIYQLVMHTCFAELVRLPSPSDLPCFALGNVFGLSSPVSCTVYADIGVFG